MSAAATTTTDAASDLATALLGSGIAQQPRVSAGELAELVTAFNDVAASLQATHETLRAEVSRLEAELRTTRRQLRRSRHLASLGEMAAGIAHEVRNPLGSIKLYAAMLVADLADRPSEREIAGKIVGSVDRANAVVGDVLAFSRRISVRWSQADALELLNDAREACAGCVSPGVRLVAPCPDRRPLPVACDAALVQQALVNVIRNALEAVAEGERPPGSPAPAVQLDIAPRSVLGPDGERIAMTALCITDNGPGLPPEVMERMFNPFFTTRAAGTGLGLAIVHRIIDAHAGRVVARNNPATEAAHGCAGATIELLLPTTPPELKTMEDQDE